MCSLLETIFLVILKVIAAPFVTTDNYKMIVTYDTTLVPLHEKTKPDVESRIAKRDSKRVSNKNLNKLI